MGKKRTEKSKYESKYSPHGFVTAAQKICEMLCEKKAAIDGKELPFKFWELVEWAKFFKSQIPAANKLLKTYREDVIFRVLRDPKNTRTYSLRAPWLKDQLDKIQKQVIIEQANLERQLEEKKGRESNIEVGTNERPAMRKKSRLNILENL